MQDDLIKTFEIYENAKEIWDQFKANFGGMITTRLWALIFKFNQYMMNSKHFMVEPISVMSAMIKEL